MSRCGERASALPRPRKYSPMWKTTSYSPLARGSLASTGASTTPCASTTPPQILRARAPSVNTSTRMPVAARLLIASSTSIRSRPHLEFNVDSADACKCGFDSRARGDEPHAGPRSGRDDVAAAQPAAACGRVIGKPREQAEDVAGRIAPAAFDDAHAIDVERNFLRRRLERLRQGNAVADNERAVALEVREHGQRVDGVQIDEARIHDLDGRVHGRHGCLQVRYAIRLRPRGKVV